MTEIQYNDRAMGLIIQRFHIAKTRVAKLLNQTNNNTINKWIKGSDIYIKTLTNIVNLYAIDLLSFLTHDGRPFTTNIEDVARMEDAGLSLPELLKEHGVQPSAPEECLSLARSGGDVVAVPSPREMKERQAEGVIRECSGDMLDRILQLQCQAHEHEREMLEQQRLDMQTIIDEKNKQIAKLEKELKRLRIIENASKPYPGMVADDSSVRTE